MSARLPISAHELLVSQVEQRLLRQGEASTPVARLVDVGQLVPAITGKVELVYEGEQEGTLNVARHLTGIACRTVFDRYFPDVIGSGTRDSGTRGSGTRDSGTRDSGTRGSGDQREADEPIDEYKPIIDWFAAGHRLELGDTMNEGDYRAALAQVPGLEALATRYLADESGGGHWAVQELVLEGLHQHSMLAKEDLATGTAYSDMLGIMLEGLK